MRSSTDSLFYVRFQGKNFAKNSESGRRSPKHIEG